MARVISTLADAVSYLNTLYEADSSAPSEGDEDYTVWTSLFNVAIAIWENEDGVLWRELFVKLADAADGDKTIAASTWDYDCPTDFVFPVGFVRTVSGNTSTYYEVIRPEEVQLRDDTSGKWCYFTGNPSTGYDLHFNPDLTITTGATIVYEYYKYATKLTAAASIFEMSDPMFAVFFALSELKKEEGDTTAAAVATQKLEAMKTRNVMPSWFQSNSINNFTESGFGT